MTTSRCKLLAEEQESDLIYAYWWVIYSRSVLQIIKLIHSCRHYLRRIKECYLITKNNTTVKNSCWTVGDLTSGCLRRRWRFMEALVDTLVPHRWQDWASTFSCVRWMCFCSMYSVRYFLSQVTHVHVFPTAAIQEDGIQSFQQPPVKICFTESSHFLSRFLLFWFHQPEEQKAVLALQHALYFCLSGWWSSVRVLPVWMSLCVSSVVLSLNVLPHSSHMKSFIPAGIEGLELAHLAHTIRWC